MHSRALNKQKNSIDLFLYYLWYSSIGLINSFSECCASYPSGHPHQWARRQKEFFMALEVSFGWKFPGDPYTDFTFCRKYLLSLSLRLFLDIYITISFVSFDPVLLFWRTWPLKTTRSGIWCGTILVGWQYSRYGTPLSNFRYCVSQAKHLLTDPTEANFWHSPYYFAYLLMKKTCLPDPDNLPSL